MSKENKRAFIIQETDVFSLIIRASMDENIPHFS
jgi:hypothetical protein